MGRLPVGASHPERAAHAAQQSRPRNDDVSFRGRLARDDGDFRILEIGDGFHQEGRKFDSDEGTCTALE